MAFEKEMLCEIAAYETYESTSEDELRKVASSKIDLPDDFEYDPDYLYMWIRIISSGEYYGPNKNGDYFPTSELEACYDTFNQAHVFKNHENKQIEKAIGKIFVVRWNPIMKCVEIFKGIDKKLAPEIVRGFQKGYMTDVSMGCRVPYTVCSVCGNKARTQKEFCSHIKNYRMQYLGNGERVFEINFEPKFHDSSVVLNGADRVSKALFILDEPVTNGTTTVRSFRKVANEKITLHETELEKVASYKKTIHPILQEPTFEKKAYSNAMMQKLAELEKEVSGKIMNIVSSPAENKPKAAEQLIQIIKFLTEKRMDEDTLKAIANNLDTISRTENLSVSKVFSTFLAVAEMMGIELFPTELHTILCEITNAKLDKSMSLSDSEVSEVYPTEFARGVRFTGDLLDKLPELDDPEQMFNAYNEVPFSMRKVMENPFDFFEEIANQESSSLEDEPPIRVIRIIKKTLQPFKPLRSHHAEHLLPRLSVVLGGHRPIIGDDDVARDVHIMSAPQTIGDVLASLMYGTYQKMRPQIINSKMVKLAQSYEQELEKVASDKVPYKGIPRLKLLGLAFPAVYGASLFQKSRDKHGKNLSDVENFIMDRPDVITAGIVLGGKPLSRVVVNSAKGGVGKVMQGGKYLKDRAGDMANRMKDGFDKLTFEEYVGLVKCADSIEAGQFNVFDEGFLNKFAEEYKVSPEQTAALKLATLLEVGELEKEAQEVKEKYQLDNYAISEFLKSASDYASEEMEKAANEFVNTMILDGIIDKRPFNATLHGRIADALVFKKLSDLGKPKAKPNETVDKTLDVANNFKNEVSSNVKI